MKKLSAPLLLGSLTLALTLFPTASEASPFPSDSRTNKPAPNRPDHATLEQALRVDLGMDMKTFIQWGNVAEQAQPMQDKLGRDGVVAFKGGKLVALGGPAPATIATADARAQGFANIEQLRTAYLNEVGPEGLTAVTYTLDGLSISVHEPDKAIDRKAANKSSKLMSPTAWAKQFPGVKVTPSAVPGKSTKAPAHAGQEFKGAGSTCSLGFTAWDRDGSLGKMTAGHCGFIMRGANLYTAGQFLGNYRWYQFGDKTNAYESWGTDLALIAPVDEYRFNLWSTVMDYHGGVIDITNVGAPVVGAPVCRSGRTTRWSCGTIYQVGWEWVNIGTTDFSKPKHWVWSAFSHMTVIEGDSGGPWISGRKAVGINSAYGWDWVGGPRHATASAAADLYAYRPGAEIMFKVEEPGVEGATMVNPVLGEYWMGGRKLVAYVTPLEGDILHPGTQVKVTIEGREPIIVGQTNGKFILDWMPPEGTVHKLMIQAIHGRSGSTPVEMWVRN